MFVFKAAIFSPTKHQALIIVGVCTLLISLAFMVAFGYVGVLRGDSEFSHNTAYFYAAGHSWLSGGNPYDYSYFVEKSLETANYDPRSLFAYPPHISAYSAFLALFPYEVAKAITACLSFLSIMVLYWFAAKIAVGEQRPEMLNLSTLFVGILLIGNPYTAHVLWLGQVSFIVTAAAVAAFFLAQQGKVIVPGVLLAFASVKPHLSILLGFWLLLDRRFALLAVAALTGLLMSLPAMIANGILVFQDWLISLSEFTKRGDDLITARHVFGLRSLISDLGIDLPNLLPFVALGTIALFWKRKHFRYEDVLSLLILMQLGLIMAKDYDIAVGMIAAGSFWFFLKDKFWQGGGALVLLAYLCFPQRIVLSHFPDIGHYREPAYLLLMAWLFWLMLKTKIASEESAVDLREIS